MESSGKKKSASKQKTSGTASRKKSKSGEKKIKEENVEMDDVKDVVTSDQPNLKDIKNRANIFPNTVENVSSTRFCLNY